MPLDSTVIQDPRLRALLTRLHENRDQPSEAGPRQRAFTANPSDYPDTGFSIWPEQGEIIYLLCRAIKARRVAEFATSIGFSTLYFAAALRDNGGGTVIGSEIVPAKVAKARRHLAEAGLAIYAEIREGDARTTLRDLGGPIDFVLIDGWPIPGDGPSLARQVTEILAPQLRTGGFLMNDNAEPDFLEFIRDPANGFISVTLPIKRGTELAVRVG
jgi:predicted O-methyltransferase YrrM